MGTYLRHALQIYSCRLLWPLVLCPLVYGCRLLWPLVLCPLVYGCRLLTSPAVFNGGCSRATGWNLIISAIQHAVSESGIYENSKAFNIRTVKGNRKHQTSPRSVNLGSQRTMPGWQLQYSLPAGLTEHGGAGSFIHSFIHIHSNHSAPSNFCHYDR